MVETRPVGFWLSVLGCVWFWVVLVVLVLFSTIRLFFPSFNDDLFFPRVRTPCGHGAQVIVEGREEQSDGGEKNKDPQTKPTPTNTPSPQAESPPSSSLSSTLGETCETETNGN